MILADARHRALSYARYYMRIVTWTVVFTLFVGTVRAQARPDAADILKRVGELYKNASEYELILDITEHDGRTDKDSRDHALFAFKPPNRYRMESTDADGKAVGVFDGVNLWMYRSQENLYTSVPGNQLTPDAPGDLGDASPEFMDATTKQGFIKLIESATESKVLREESIPLEGSGVECYVIEITGPKGTETWWTDKARYRILRQDSANRSVVFTTVKINEPLSEDLFKFEPPPGAKKAEPQQ